MVNTTNRKGEKLSNRSILVRFLILLGILILITSGWAWWHYIRSNPKRVFWDTVGHALATSTINRETKLDDGTQSAVQKAYVVVTPKQFAFGANEIKQDGAGGFDVLTDIIGTPTTDFTRYSAIKTDQKDAQGKAPNTKSIIGVWGKSDSPAGQTNGQLYGQTVLGVVPFANLTYAQRKELTNLMQTKNAYQVDYNKVLRSTKNGRPVYTYDVTVNPEAYITMLKKFASFVGLTQLDQTNPADFRSTAPIQFQFDVDVWTQQLTEIRYANGRQEHYGFGARIPLPDTPNNAISIDELQKRIQAAQ